MNNKQKGMLQLIYATVPILLMKSSQLYSRVNLALAILSLIFIISAFRYLVLSQANKSQEKSF